MIANGIAPRHTGFSRWNTRMTIQLQQSSRPAGIIAQTFGHASLRVQRRQHHHIPVFAGSSNTPEKDEAMSASSLSLR